MTTDRKATTTEQLKLRARLSGTAVQWDVFLQLAEAGDANVDSTAVWPDTRRKVARPARWVMKQTLRQPQRRAP
ncbi:MAG: hypothetical protein AAFW74_14095, partial [Pseudomonadota bacterium]